MLVGPIQRALDYARERGLPLLAADLLVSLAVCTGDPNPALEAISLSGQAPLARGRARVEAALLGAPVELARAEEELRADAVHAALALVAGLDPEAGRARLAVIFGDPDPACRSGGRA